MAVPASIPVSVAVVPEPETVAIAALLLSQVPPLVAQLNVVVIPSHVIEPPVIATGEGLTTIVVVVGLDGIPDEVTTQL